MDEQTKRVLVREGVGTLYHLSKLGNDEWDSWTDDERRLWLVRVDELTKTMHDFYPKVES